MTDLKNSLEQSSVPPVAAELAISGMTCANCARHVTEAIQSVPGVQSASVNLEARQAFVRWSSGSERNIPAIIHAVESAGYGAKIIADEAPHDHDRCKLSGWQLNLWIGVLGTLPLMIGDWIFDLGMQNWFRWFSFALAGIVQIFAGAQFYRGAWRQIKVGGSNMDTLVALGSTTAFGYSLWALFAGSSGHLYFMEAAAIITLISIGHWLEARMGARASSALKSLLNLAPQTARLRQSDGSEIEINVAALKCGDHIILKPGDRVPTDGEVAEGDSAVDESMLTGESVPVDKTAKSGLYAGTVNLNGRLVMRVIATGESTALANIIAAVQRAQTSRANIQRLGDRVSSIFVPVVVAIAVSSGLWWGFAPESAMRVHHWLGQFLWPAHPPTGSATAFIVAAAVLIVACPCAMGLATPAAIMAGANAAARLGILIRDGVALEKAGEVTAVVFDKTGTLTTGKPAVVQIWKSGQDVAIAASLARNSTHPISQAIANISSEEIEFADWQEVRGSGVQATMSSSHSPVRLGSLNWLKESGVDLSPGEAFINEWSSQGATIVGLMLGKSLQGLFAVKDTVKPGAAQVVERLQRQGLKTYLLTGDNGLTAASIAKQVGIAPKNIFAEVRPEQKAEFVRQLQQQGEKVAFVGDGINDAPALEQADLGIAVSRASDIAREAADIILLKSEIEAVPEALGLARATLRTIKQNLFWAFFYNAAVVPLAAAGFMSPILCAAAMGLSDSIVIGNALRLRNWRLRH
jgi:Cu+-exporting ATPase